MARGLPCIFTTALILAATHGTARAQRAPDLSTLDRGDGISKIGLDAGLSFLEGLYSSALRLELHGQYITNSGLGFYGAVPLAASFGDDDDPPGDQDSLALGNIDVGMLFVTGGRTVSWVFRGGVALPTASSSLDGALTNSAAVWPRLTDAALTAPESFYIRLGVSPILHARKFFFQADLGFDLGTDATDFLRINVGGGYDFGTVVPSIELVNLGALDDGVDFSHTVTLTLRFMTRRLEPFVAVGMPLDNDGVDLYLAGGIQAPF